jgi:hypothetical protein
MRSGWLPAGRLLLVASLRASFPACADKAAQHASSSPLGIGINIVVDTYLML